MEGRQGGYGALFTVFALRLRQTEPTTSGEVRSLGEGGPGTNFIEHYECRACLPVGRVQG
jgi:hypothetical protein